MLAYVNSDIALRAFGVKTEEPTFVKLKEHLWDIWLGKSDTTASYRELNNNEKCLKFGSCMETRMLSWYFALLLYLPYFTSCHYTPFILDLHFLFTLKMNSTFMKYTWQAAGTYFWG